jgi:hypothetical protein
LVGRKRKVRVHLWVDADRLDFARIHQTNLSEFFDSCLLAYQNAVMAFVYPLLLPEKRCHGQNDGQGQQ